MRRALLAAIPLLLIAGAGCGIPVPFVTRSAAPPPATTAAPTPTPTPTPTEDATTTVTATLDLVDQDTADADCEGQGGYADIDTGATVTIVDQKQEIVGSTTLDTGTADGDTCTWEMTFEEVPTDHTQYTLTIGDRGGLTQSKKTMIENDWAFFAQIGE